MPDGDRTTIQVSLVVWQYLNQKRLPGDSFDDVLRRELGVVEPVSDDAIRDRVRDMDWPKNHAQDDQRERAVVAAAQALRDEGPLSIGAIDAAALEAVPTLGDELGENTRRRMLRRCLTTLPWVERVGRGKYEWDNQTG